MAVFLSVATPACVRSVNPVAALTSASEGQRGLEIEAPGATGAVAGEWAAGADDAEEAACPVGCGAEAADDPTPLAEQPASAATTARATTMCFTSKERTGICQAVPRIPLKTAIVELRGTGTPPASLPLIAASARHSDGCRMSLR